MTGGKFASLTAGLLVRKGEARPSSILPQMGYSLPPAQERMSLPERFQAAERATVPLRFPLSAADRAWEVLESDVPESDAVVPLAPPVAVLAEARQAPPPAAAKPLKRRSTPPPPPPPTEKPRRLMVTLTPAEYETLGLIGVKKSTTRHQLLRNAVDEYLALLVEEYGGDCQCIYTGFANCSCKNDCS